MISKPKHGNLFDLGPANLAAVNTSADKNGKTVSYWVSKLLSSYQLLYHGYQMGYTQPNHQPTARHPWGFVSHQFSSFSF